ncbi:MAG: ORF6N domain-containing protein [Halobacteriovoraceae bacterium]|nr:ORF6N domain-containing protein [Halobacteriovoraceae bacterium]
MNTEIDDIKDMIYVIRGCKVMLDSDLAHLYGVETKILNRQVRRNIKKFPSDFMFQLTDEEFELLKCQIGTSKQTRGGKQKKPLVFTENGVAMLSGILRSDRAIHVNIAIMRIFTRLRSFYMLEKEFDIKIDTLKNSTNKVFKIVFERLDNLENNALELPRRKRKIGLNEK